MKSGRTVVIIRYFPPVEPSDEPARQEQKAEGKHDFLNGPSIWILGLKIYGLIQPAVSLRAEASAIAVCGPIRLSADTSLRLTLNMGFVF